MAYPGHILIIAYLLVQASSRAVANLHIQITLDVSALRPSDVESGKPCETVFTSM